MPGDRQAQMRSALQAVAALSDPASSPNVRPMSGDWAGCFRLRVGSYRAIFRVIPPELPEAPEGTLDVLLIGPRGDVYK
jgi:mRNA-degrading endonuclease RelE of RelBE toxin-antitoxin system